MKKLKKIVAAVALCTMAVSAMGCKMIEKTPEAIQNTVLAKVGNDKVIVKDIEKQLKPYTDQLKQQYGADYEKNEQISTQLKQYKKQILDNLVNEKILLQKATELNLKPSDDEINKQVDDEINKYKSQYSQEGQYDQFLKQNGFTEEELKTFLKNQAIVKPVIDDVMKDVSVSDEDVQNYYNENKDSQYTVGAGATASHILVKDEETAKKLKAKLDAGADFAQLAKENSTDPGTKDNGGSLGFVPYNSTQFVKEFMDGFKNLKEGQVSDPVKSQFGYHLIKATGLKEAQVTPLDKVKDEIKSQLEQQKKNEAFTSKIEEWKKALNVKIYEDRL